MSSTFTLDWNDADVKRDVDGSVFALVAQGAAEVLKMARADCPEGDTGALKESGRIVTFRKPDAMGAYVTFGGRGYMSKGVDTYYAPFVELGTPGTVYRAKKRKGQPRVAVKALPFLRTALKRVSSQHLSGYENAVK